MKEDLITEFKKAITSTVKAIANNKDIEVVFDNNAFKSENTIVLPKIDNENDLEFLSSIRGNADNQALMYRFHDKETFELMSPTGHKNKEIYEVLENTRIQILVSKIMRGVKSNLFSLYEKKCSENQMFEASEQSDIDIQNALDATISMQLDECIPFPASHEESERAMKLSLEWALKSRETFEERKGYGQFGIVQGSTYSDLRELSSKKLVEIGFDGYAIGGLAVGEGQELMFKTLDFTTKNMPFDKPRYLMGVGTPINLLENISLGVDMFDCVMPTRNARNGMLFTAHGTINIKNEKWKNDFSNIDDGNHSYVDSYYSKAYLRHLFTVKESVGRQIATIHNLAFYMWLVREARTHIIEGDFLEWKNLMVKQMSNKL